MTSVNIKTVASLIDATAHVEEKTVAIQYVTSKGYLREMLISKRIPAKKTSSKSPSSKPKRTWSNVKMNGLVEILDHTQGESIPKTLFLYAIIGFNPDGDLNNLYPVS